MTYADSFFISLESVRMGRHRTHFTRLVEKSSLSPREIEVCTFIRDGFPNKDIAERLFISPHTVNQHLKKIHKKLGTHTRSQLVSLLNQ